MKNKKKVLIITSIIVFTILAIYFYTCKKNELEINEYKKYAIEYLNNNYKDEFELEYDSFYI